MDSVQVSGLELINFKSYRHLIIDNLEKSSLFALVGMNGLGKSNIVDALLYALGENRLMTLRIHRFANLIRREDDGEEIPNSCSVKLKLIIHNESMHYERSTIRNGTSVFKVNGVAVSQSQYCQNLLQIGINTSVQNYFILQGNIQDVALMSNNEMSTFLEKVSGSITFKKDHDNLAKEHKEAQETLTKRHKTKLRLAACERQGKKQVARLATLHNLKTRMKNEQVTLALFIEYQLAQQISESKEDLNHILDTIKTLKYNCAELEKRRVSVNNEAIIQTASNIAKCEQALELVIAQTDALNKELQAAFKVEKNISTDITKLNIFQEKSLAEIARINQEMQKYNVARFKLQNKLENYVDITPEVISEYAHLKESAAKRIVELSTPVDVESNLLRKVNRISYNKQQRALHKSQKSAEFFLDRCEYYDFECQQLESSNGSTTTSSSEEENLIPQYSQVGSDYTNLTDNVLALQLNLYKVENAIYHSNANSDLDHISQQYEGVVGKLRNLLHAKPGKQRYQWVISASLARFLNTIVVDNLHTANRAGNCLSNLRLIRFMIIPSQFVQISAINSNIEDSELVSNILARMDAAQIAIDCEEDAIIVKTPQRARSVLNEMGVTTNTITELGRKFNRNKIIIFNCKIKKYPNISLNDLIRDLEELGIDSFKTAITDQSEEFIMVMHTMSNIEKIKRNKLQVPELKLVLKNTQNQYSKIQKQVQSIENEIKELQNELNKPTEEVSIDCNQIEDEIFADLCAQHGFENVRLLENHIFVNSKEKIIKDMEAKRACFEDCEHLIKTHQTEIEKRGKLMELNRKNMDQTLEERTRICIALEQVEVQHSVNLKKLQNLQTLYENMKVGVSEEKLELDRQIGEIEDAAYKANESAKDSRLKIELLSKDRENHIKQCYRNHIILPLVSNEEESFNNSFNDFDYSELPLALRCKVSEQSYTNIKQTLRNKINTTEEEIEAMGDVPAAAVEDLRDLHIDYLEATQQYKEAAEVEIELRRNVERLHNERTECLNTCLEFLRGSLDHIYKEMTNSNAGCAQIFAVNPQLPYSAGISYMCAVPQKQFNRISNLSSGEKSMAGLALYFALKEFKPSPIYILDEVDARLDSNNLERFARFLSRHQEDGVQTLMVTHKSKIAAVATECMTIITESDGGAGVVKLNLNPYTLQ